MAAVMDGNLASILSKIMDCYGLDDDNRKRRMDSQKLMQLLMSWQVYLSSNSVFGDVLISGSSYETTTVDGLSSDIDFMYINKNIRIIEDIGHWTPDTSVDTYIMDNSGSCKAFVKLYLLSKHYPGPVLRDTIKTLPKGHVSETNNKILLENKSKYFVGVDEALKQHGPALTETRLAVECDNVTCLKCDCFPTVSLGWKERQSSRTWTDDTIIDQAKHCYLVGVGNKGSLTENVEWRLSFSHIENKLVHAWNNIQYKSYVMMKFIKKELIESSVPGVICSYHFKTILMWMNEEYEREFFVTSNFDNCLLTCIKNLLIFTKKRSLPHYFIEGCNLFHGKMNKELKQAASILERILSTWPQCLFKIKCRKLGMILQSCLSHNIPPRIVCKRMYGEHVSGGYFGVKHEREHFFGCYLIARVSLKNDAMDILKSLFDLKKRTYSVAWDYEMECKEFIEFLIKDALCRFGLALLRQSDTVGNKRALSYKRTGYCCIQRYIKDCFAATCLEIAGHFTLVGDFQTALRLLEKAEKQMKCLTFVPGPDFNNITIKEHGEYYYVGDIWYTMDNLRHVLRGLAYEFFHNTPISPPLELMSKYDYNRYFHKNSGNISIPSSVFMYYLQFHCFHGLGCHSQSIVALENMEWISKYKEGQISDEYKYNIIGDCYRTRGEDRKAYWYYRKSLEKHKHHNAVMWHLAVLLRSRSRGKQR